MAREFAADAATPPSWLWWMFVAVLALALLAVPKFTDVSLQLDLSIIFVLSLLALSMSFLWGYVGILSFGQTIFFGLGGYSYAILALNAGATLWPFAAAICLPMIFAAVLGYFVIYGRINDIYLSVITLVVTLIFEKSIRSTSGPEYVIGSVRLNGQNGIPGVPGLQLPWDGSALTIDGVFYLAGATALLVYVGLRLLLLTSFGRIIVGIRENERRAELLGYDPRAYKLATFVIGGALAGFAGCLFANWGNFVSPTIFGLAQSAQIIIWVIVGGRGTLIGPVIGCIGIQWLSAALGANQPSGGSDLWSKIFANAPLILGIILIAFVLLVPKGLVPTLVDFGQTLVRARRQRKQRGFEPQQAE